MQAQLTLRRSPSTFFIALFVIAAAILLGGTLGYILKPAVVSPGPARVVVVHDEASLYVTGTGSDYGDPCVWSGHVKAC